MNGDMPHVPITTLAGIASLTDLLNQLPLPSPLPATTTKSLLFNGRIAEEVNCLLACRDENLVSQLIHSLNQVSTDHIELKDNLGSDDPEGDIPVLLQAILARNPNVFREKSMQNRYGVQSGMMMSQFNMSQNSMRGSPASSNYQQTTISHSPSSRFVPPQTSSGNRFLAQQNSPVPSPYAPQSPAGYMPYSHPPSYTPHPQMQQASVSSPIVTAGMRNLHENKVSSQLSGNSANHHADNSRHGSNEDYLQMVHRLSSDDGDPSIRNAASFSLRSPQSVCSPAGSDGTLKGSRQPLIQQSQPPPYSSPRDVPPDILLDSPERKQKKQKKMKLGKDEKDQTEKAAMYDIISSPSKDSTKLTLRLSRVRSSDMDQQDDMLSGLENSSVSEGDIPFNVQYPGQTSKTPVTPQDVNRPLNAAQCLPQHEQTAFLQAHQVPVLQQNTSVAAKQPQTPVVQTQQQVSQQGTITSYDEVELDALAEIERIERESAIERERFSKEVQDKASRKRHKKDRDEAWEYEEHDRRSSGDHRRSGHYHEGRRTSGSGRYRNRSPDDSDMDDYSSPPSLSEVARKMKKKEKQKKRKAYEPKLTPEEMMDSSTFKRFTASIENILENLEDMDFTAFGDDDEIPQELLLGKHQLSELGSESAKIKAMGIMDKLSTDKTVKVLNILEKNIQDGSKLSTLLNHNNDTEDEERLWRDLIMERVTKSADACLTAINIMTSPNMPKAVYIEDVIERVIQYTKFHLQNTLYPQYDPVYRVDPHGGGVLSSKAKRAKCSTHKQRVIVMLYNKVCDIVSSLSELLEIQLLTDTTILQVSSMGITPFFVENVSELQLCAIKLVTAVFSRYEKHRQLILEEIFTSLARLPTSKRSLRNFRLNSSDTDGEPMYIQMVTALVLQLIQCVVHLPSAEKDSNSEEESNKKVDQDVLITNSYETAMRTAQNFLSIFLKKCGSKQGEEDYRPLFENFIQDLLSTVNKPEWPAAELLLSLLGRLLVHQFSNKSTEMALRVASLDYLGTVAARLRKDAVTSKMDQGSIARILKQVSGGEDEIQQLQKALLDYLDENTETDASLVFSRKFYVAQWFRDTTMETEKAIKSQKDEDSSEGTHHAKDVETTGQIMHRAESRKKFLRSIIKTAPSQFSTLKMNSDTVDYEDACLIVRYLASMRPFAQSFDIYLTQILRVLGENAIAVRTKAMKCLSEVVAVDPSILARLDMQRGVHGRLMDNSTSVREAAVELLGRFVLCRPQLAEQYYDMLIERILDTGISVRKRVIKILRDICIEQPTFPKITEMCVKMIRRVNDEEGIKKLVNETFQKLWFTPTPHHDKEAMTRKILNITDVVAACRDTGYDWFEQLLQNLLKSEEDASYKPVKKACTQLVDNLVEHILKYEESLSDSDNKGVNSGRLVACITTLFLFSKIRPQLMVKHAMTMQPYLTTKCSTQNDFMVICNVAKILELVVPLMEHPSETFLATIEEDLMKLIIKYGMTVVQHCVSCLGAVVNKVTQNYKFVWACFNRYYGALSKLKSQHQEDPNSTILTANKPALLRSLFTVGALCRHFDFDHEDFKGNSKVNIKDKVLELLMYFTKHSDEEVQTKAIIGLGFAFIQHPSLMFEQEVKTLYNSILSDKNCSVNLKIQVLKNLQTYLQEEDTRMQQADRDWKKVAKQEDLKEMGDISSGMSSSIMQLYLKQVLEAFFHTQSSVRHFALNVIALTLNQGLIHPVQCVPYLIAMGTDPEPSMRNKADQQLVEIDKKYAGFIHMKAVAGMKMSYQVQQAINTCPKDPVRGFRHDESSSALCSHLYSMIRGNRQHRRAFLISLLNLFDDTAKTEVNMLLYIADNLACFPYQTQEEPLFIMHHIDITLSVSGSNLLQSFKESMVKDKKKERKPSSDEETESDSNSGSESESEEEASKPRRLRKRADSDSDSDEENDINAVMKCLPENSAPLIEFANVSQGILLLLMLKQHLKNLCGFSDSKIQKYSPSESAKVYDKAINRKTGVHFHPKQTLDFLRSDMANSKITEEVKRSIVKQYLDFKLLMEHLDPDEEEEDGEVSASTNARNKAITSLLGGGSPKNNAAETEDDESDGEDRGGGTSGSLRRSKRNSDSTELAAQMNESVDVMDVIAICCPKYKDRPQIARVVQKTSNGFSVQWMAGSYSGSWTEAKRRDGRKLVPWVDTIKESDIIYKKIALTSANKLTNKVVQTLRSLYAAKDGTSS
ncbi:nipped-B-like protein isoform X8 [Pezoporus wallicus]|uniref:nipped-B-like protein isoform X8 n=1 Tax=Pezoporus wallicus TaxID=35540 RepID=UPI00254BD35F|nr:nipped-B-like protein isoform X8 [Pezoporus wallicus]XP_061325462.1 nipped-B-like protein isoform X8 [Pezoporus flaviventris]